MKLPKKYHDGQWNLGPGAISGRPQHAEAIGRCIGLWTDTEVQMAILLSILMRADEDASIAVYSVLRRATPRYEAINAAASAKPLIPSPRLAGFECFWRRRIGAQVEMG